MSTETVVDVRRIPPRERHPKIFKTWEALPVGGVLKLVNDHDPKPLFYEFRAEREGEFEWQPVERGPEQWVVDIKRISAPRLTTAAITPDQTVKEVMTKYPATERVFAAHGLDLCCGGSHPIQMAAQAHGVALDPLLADLQQSAGSAPPALQVPLAPRAAAQKSDAKPDWFKSSPDHEVDVREDLKKGSDPFKKIMAAAGGVQPGQVLCVRAIFEPKPLYAVLGMKGFEHYGEQAGDQDWKVYFFKPLKGTKRIPIQAAPAGKPSTGRVISLDVRGLEPPEPMVKILSRLPELGPEDALEVTHFREPIHLYPHLEEAGFTHEIKKESETLYRLTIKKK